MKNVFLITAIGGTVRKSLRLFFTGFTMGSADLVPGVSGGTIAFLFGIYEELIQSIKSVSGQVPRLLLKGKLKEAWQIVPLGFVVPLGLGMLTAIVTLSNVLSYLLQEHPSYLWSFFFGLIVTSIVIVSRRVVTWNVHDYVAAGVTAVVAFFLVGIVPVETPQTLPALFIAGAIAICAMILPGISGSFLLVIMGKYEQVLGAVTNRDIVPLVVFGLGTVLGLALFSRVISYLFKNHHDIMIAMLTGFMIGSLRKIWPWKEVILTRINSHGEIVPLIEKNILPSQLDMTVVISLLLFFTGIGAMVLLNKLQITKETVSDINDPQFIKEHTKSLKSQASGKI